ncbi:MAG: hypothetical protein ACTSPI_10370 [Candidatus Heimdallarchaeaceae archaeon]
MSASKISDYTIGGSNWTELLTTIEKQRKGYNGISLTNYDNNSLPAIAAGSYFEISGALYGFTTEAAITGSPSSDNINYIYINGTTFVPVWTTTAPTWSDAKYGWYDAGETHRYVAGCYYDGTNYLGKWLYCNRQYFPTRYCSPSMIGWMNDTQYGGFSDGYAFFLSGADVNKAIYIPVSLPHGCTITQLKAWMITQGGQGITLWLKRSHRDANTDILASCYTNSTSSVEVTDDTIDYPSVDNTTYSYLLHFQPNSTLTDTARLHGVEITYIQY